MATESDEDKPWEAYGRQRLDVEPHRGRLVAALGTAATVFGVLSVCGGLPGLAGLVLGFVAWRMACADVPRMLAGQMDRRGEARTRRGGDFGLCGMVLSLLGCGAWLGWILDRFR